MEKEILSQGTNQELIKVRCPQCFKLYNVRSESIQSKKPKFKCNECQEGFSLNYPECLGMDEVIGFADSWEEPLDAPESPEDTKVKEVLEASVEVKAAVEETEPTDTVHDAPQEETLPCVKCGALNPVSFKECQKCGIIFEKYQVKKDDPIGAKAPQKLKEIWQMVLNHYEDDDLHEEFLRQSRKANQLEFASSRYRKILEAQPNEEIAKRYINKIIALASIPAEKPIKDEAKRKFRVPFTSLAMLLSAIVMFMGYMMPELRNLMGIGAAFLFITTAIRLIFK